mgnify:CR=1 FL=1
MVRFFCICFNFDILNTPLRALNVAADYLCAVATQTRCELVQTSPAQVANYVREGACLQFHSDGSWTDGVGGAYAFTVCAWLRSEDGWTRYLLGTYANFSSDMQGPFQAETLALHAAVRHFLNVASLC